MPRNSAVQCREILCQGARFSPSPTLLCTTTSSLSFGFLRSALAPVQRWDHNILRSTRRYAASAPTIEWGPFYLRDKHMIQDIFGDAERISKLPRPCLFKNISESKIVAVRCVSVCVEIARLSTHEIAMLCSHIEVLMSQYPGELRFL